MLPRQETAYLIGKILDVISGRDHRPGAVGETLFHIRAAWSGLRMQHIPALCIQAIASQLVEAGDAPDIGGDAIIFFQHFRAGNHFAQDRAAAQQLHARLSLRRFTFAQQIHAAQNTLLRALGHGRVRVVLVHHRDVIEHVFLFLIHAAHTILNDHRQLIGKSRVVRYAVGHGARHDVTVAVFMLQAFAIERRAPGGAAQQKAARAHVPGSPRQITDTLKAEHRVEDVKRDHHLPVIAVGSGRCYP